MVADPRSQVVLRALVRRAGLAALLALACQGGARPGPAREAGVDERAPEGGDPAELAGDGYWLTGLGWGSAQNARVCQSGRADEVIRRLCRPDVGFTSMTELQQQLGLTSGDQNLAIASRSSGLGFRVVSALNPRLFLNSPAPRGQGARAAGLAGSLQAPGR
jgi:hypothetical protein